MARWGNKAGWLLSVSAIVCVGSVAVGWFGARAQTEAPRTHAVEIKFTKNAAGTAESAKLAGPDDQKGVFYTSRLHLFKGAVIAPHTHPDTRYVTVLSGTLYVCNSATVSADAAQAFPEGSFFVEPAGVVHCSWAKDGDVLYQESGIGPTEVIPLKK